MVSDYSAAHRQQFMRHGDSWLFWVMWLHLNCDVVLSAFTAPELKKDATESCNKDSVSNRNLRFVGWEIFTRTVYNDSDLYLCQTFFPCTYGFYWASSSSVKDQTQRNLTIVLIAWSFGGEEHINLSILFLIYWILYLAVMFNSTVQYS